LSDDAISSVINDLHDNADDLSIQNYDLDYRTDCDGNLAVVFSFGHVADMVLFKIRVS